jgi:hypothetical protein
MPRAEVAARVAAFLPLLVFIVSVLLPYQASAVGVGAAPSELDFSIRPGGSATETLHVLNTGDSEAHYRVYVEEEYEGWFDISPEEFSLAAQGNKETHVKVSAPLFSSGDHSTHVHVVAANSEAELGVGVGIKVPAHIRVSNLLAWVGLGIAIALLLTLTLFLIRRRRLAAREAR